MIEITEKTLRYRFIRDRIKTVGERVGVKVYPHRLRHTAATQLLNAGCRVTSIQKFLGHKELSTTMIYARVHDRTVADDYYAAMGQVEKRLDLLGEQENYQEVINENTRVQLLNLATQLAVPELDIESRLKIVVQIQSLLSGKDISPNEIFLDKMSVNKIRSDG